MKKIQLLLFALTILFVTKVQAQDVAIDSTKNWKIHGENTFLINQSSFSNWAAGGVNSFAGNIMLNYDFNYKKDKWSWDNKVIAAYGQTFQKETDWRKNDDRFAINSLLGYQIKERWLYTFFLNFNTQFAKGYDYTSTNRKLISDAFSPAYLSFGPGIAYKKSDNFKFNLSPAALRFVFVTNDSLATTYGVDAGKNSRVEFGASFDAYYKTQIMENVTFENILKLYSNYLEDPQNVDVDYTANLAMKVNKWITVNAGVQMIYDDNTELPKIVNGVEVGKKSDLQVKQILGAGITYKF
ncbi:DUF3078 domain-containing protein [Sphingobacterium sp. SRCM116780]|uniref:DUF3078 domain-containing protein n=1 Tax=Sphingobacterium sp. SRCM116780 TaxID=2907623 RepID=UPI001F2EFE38|nr:DUF3078 domain-containing protein [Sphingobacterium sp. SRCM116780]UIR54567.1 DUF3078 domain-containing protein [Sphingobacterium sp. SRCM116780]